VAPLDAVDRVMSAWLWLASWVTGWLIAVRPSMRRTMLREVCSECSYAWMCDCDRDEAGRKRKPKPKRVVAGSKFDRDGYEVGWSLWIAAWWPVWLAFASLRLFGRGVARGVIRATPLTAPELERRIAERDEEIARLTKQIGPP
jgi:hypothetical protein